MVGMLPHMQNQRQRPGMPNLGHSVMYQASQMKKTYRTKGWLKALFGSPVNAMLCILVAFVFASGGLFYGVLINKLDEGNSEHDAHGGFWGRKTHLRATNSTGQGGGVGGGGAGTRQAAVQQALAGEEKSKGSKGGADAAEGAWGSKREEDKRGDAGKGKFGKIVGGLLGGSGGIRGMDPARKKAYEGVNGVFECDQGATKVALSKVNDDYCDCLDGSDEPGTSACDSGSFYCKHWADAWKQGAKSGAHAKVQSSKVNDGVCDCCDGSDEWARPDVKCSDTCK